jgi:release factor glutamine methyltransferase
MNIEEWLKTAAANLADCNIPTARLDCLVLLEDCLNTNRAQLLAHPELALTNEQIKRLGEQLERRCRHEPLAYIRGFCEFYGREFYVDKRTLIPRPETESVIDFVKSLPQKTILRVADIGSGSGCIGITIALELPHSKVDLYDIDQSTFEVSASNANKYDAIVELRVSSLLQDVNDRYDVIVANLPYVPDGKLENLDAHFEPPLALFAGKDGLDLYRKFWDQLNRLEHKPSFVIIESMPGQHETLSLLASRTGYKLASTNGLVQKFELSQETKGA